MKNLSKLKKIIIPIIMILIELFLYFQMISEKPHITFKYRIMYLIICIISNFVGVLLLKILQKKPKLKIEKVFACIAIPIGLLYLIFIPALLGTDELPHFLRPYQISVGDIIVRHPESNETEIPKDISHFVGERDMIKRYSKDNVFESVDYSDTENLWNGDVTSIRYSPISYIPQIIGFWIAKLIKLSPLFTLFIVRLCNFSVWLAISYFAFKLLPTKKIFALLLYTAPSVLSVVSTCNYDAFTLALMFLLISYILNIIKNNKIINKKNLTILLLISFGISTYKIFYIIYLLLILIIPTKCYKNIKQKIIYSLSIFLISLFADLGWYFITTVSSITESSLISEQIKFILSNPLYYICVFVNTYIDNIYYYITNIVAGSEMCYGLARINQLFILVYLSLLFYSCTVENEEIRLKKSSKILIALISISIFALVSTTLYLEWTASISGIGASRILGIQSRYFICLLLPLSLLLPKKFCIRINKDNKNSKNRVIILSCLTNLIIFINCIKSLLVAIFKA